MEQDGKTIKLQIVSIWITLLFFVCVLVFFFSFYKIRNLVIKLFNLVNEFSTVKGVSRKFTTTESTEIFIYILLYTINTYHRDMLFLEDGIIFASPWPLLNC